MAMLVPLLLPHIVAASANIGKSTFETDIPPSLADLPLRSWSVERIPRRLVFGVGADRQKGVYNEEKLQPQRTTHRAADTDHSHGFGREQIVLILPIPDFIHPGEPLFRREMREIDSHNPFNPESEHYGSIMGDTVEANGYPISAWRWMMVSRGWREVLKDPMWAHLEVKGYHRYARLIKGLDSKNGVPALSRVKCMTIREGFRSPEEIYSILCAPNLSSLEEVSIMPDYPTSFHQLVFAIPSFPFGLQLVRTAKPMKAFTYGLPLESTTNTVSRDRLRSLAPARLSLTFVRPTIALFDELKSLVAESTRLFTIRYVPLRGFVEASVFLCPALAEFDNVEIHLLLPRPRMTFIGTGDSRRLVEDPESPGKRFVQALEDGLELAPAETQAKYTVWTVDEWDIPGRAHKAVKSKLWPKEALWDMDAEFNFDADTADDKVTSSSLETKTESAKSYAKTEKGKGRPAHWERETNLRLLGGLFNLRLESKKH